MVVEAEGLEVEVAVAVEGGWAVLTTFGRRSAGVVGEPVFFGINAQHNTGRARQDEANADQKGVA